MSFRHFIAPALLAVAVLAACRPVGDDYEPDAPTPAPAPEPSRISFVHGAGQHDPEQWASVSVATLLMRHGDGIRALKGKCLAEFGPNHAHVGAHRYDTREVA